MWIVGFSVIGGSIALSAAHVPAKLLPLAMVAQLQGLLQMLISLLVGWAVLLLPALLLYRFLKRKLGATGAAIGFLPLAFSWLVMVLLPPSQVARSFAGADEPTKFVLLFVGEAFVALLAMDIVRRVRLQVPSCRACAGHAKHTVHVVDYWPTEQRVTLEFDNPIYARAFWQANPTARAESDTVPMALPMDAAATIGAPSVSTSRKGDLLGFLIKCAFVAVAIGSLILLLAQRNDEATSPTQAVPSKKQDK